MYKVLILIVIILFAGIISYPSFSANLIKQSDVICVSNTCIYYNKTMFFDSCEKQYGEFNWMLNIVNVTEPGNIVRISVIPPTYMSCSRNIFSYPR